MDCRFYGVVIPPGESVLVQANFDEDIVETVHFTQAALGAKPKPGAHVVFVEKDGEKFAIGTLDGARCAQFSCDVTFAMDEVTLSHSGAGEVHLTGYRVEQMLAGASEDEDGYGYGSEEESEEEEEEEESEDEDAPLAVPLKGLRGLADKAIKPRARRLVDDEAEEASSEEEEEEEEGEEMEDDSDVEEPAGGGRTVRIVDDDDDESDEEEESSGEEESEEEPAPAAKPAKKQQQQQPAAAAAGAKRPAPQQPAKTPQPAKKDKSEQQKAPATAPAKVAPAAAGMATPGSTKEYIAALQEALRAVGGPIKLAQLGSKVKRPPGVPKLKHVIDSHPALFKYSKDTDQVTLVA